MRTLICILFAFLLPLSCIGQSDSNRLYTTVQLSNNDTVQDTLNAYVKKINSLWNEGTSSLNMAAEYFTFLSRISADNYYKQASVYYFWSLKNASFENEGHAIEQEVNQLLPLLSDSTKEKWTQYIEQKNSQIFNEIIGFWKIRDTYPSTELNERLIEHWQRIAYAREHFTENEDTPYGTDDRGLIYVRFGPPHVKVKESAEIRSIPSPFGNPLDIRYGPSIRGSFELWTYYDIRKPDTFFIFGEHNKQGSYGLQESILNVFNYENVQLRTSQFVDFISRGSTTNNNGRAFRRLTLPRLMSDAVSIYGIFEEVRNYHPHFDSMYQRMNGELLAGFSPAVRIFESFAYNIPPNDRYRTYRQMVATPGNATNLLTENTKLDMRNRFYRFRDKQGNMKYIFAAAARPHASHQDTTTYFTKDNLYAYNNQWNLIARENRINSRPDRPFVLAIKNLDRESTFYYSSELWGRTSETGSVLIAASGQQTIKLPKPLPKTTPFTVSDVVLADEQEADDKNAIPIVPKLQHSFEKDRPMMIYFEAYGVPEGGYSFNYFFKKDRWLLPHKKIERTEITVLADKAQDHDSQLFTINPKDLEPGTYNLVFRFNPLEKAGQTKPLEKKVEIEIKK